MAEKVQKSPRILAVDDDQFIRKMFKSILTPKGFEVLTAVDGSEAVKLAIDAQPDLIFLDIMMPNVDGFQALSMIRKMQQTQHIPVIIVTARSDTRTLLKAIKMGANDFIAKPFTRSDLIRKIRFALLRPDQQKKETESAFVKEKSTFLESSAFQIMRENFIFKFEKIFLEMVKLISGLEKNALSALLENLIETCELYELSVARSLAIKMQEGLDRDDWDIVIEELEKMYYLFQDLRLQYSASGMENE